jgi:hypothetical protein
LGSCYFADTYYIDGQALAPSEFGEVNEDTGEWVPIEYSGTYAGNSTFLNYSDSADFGTDSSGLGNDFTATSIPTTQQSLDSPTNNFATLNPLVKPYGTNTYSEGNLKTVSGSGWQASMSTISASSGKWYYETLCGGSNQHCYIIGTQTDLWFRGGQSPQDTTTGTIGYMGYDGKKRIDTVDTSYGATFGSGDIIAVALDLDAGTPTVTFYKNNVSQGVITFTGNILNSSIFLPAFVTLSQTTYWNFGSDSSFAGNKTAQGNQDSNSIGDFYYEPPTGYLALCTSNLPDPEIALPGENFNNIIYTGDGGLDVTGVGFQPDLVWVKDRGNAYHHQLHDSVRGATAGMINSNQTADENSTYQFDSFDADGFTTDSGNITGINGNTNNYIAWNWKAGSSASGTTGGSGTSKSYTAKYSTDAGISIIGFEGNDTAGHTVPHHLSVAPELVIVKNRTNAAHDWQTGSDYLTSWEYRLKLNDIVAEAAVSSSFDSTAPSSSVITLGSNSDVNEDGSDMIIYAFHSIPGYSKVGSYEGNGNADGTFIYTGFKPSYVLIKDIDNAYGWHLFDDARDPYNAMYHYLRPSDNTVEGTTPVFGDFVSNGFKLRTGTSGWNDSSTHIYIAFAESPFKTSNAR